MAMNLEQVAFTVVDVETTGLYPETGDRIVEIGAVKVRDGTELGRYETLVNPQRPISPEAFAQNKISSEMLYRAPLFASVVGEFTRFVEGTALVAQNAKFDLGFINSELIRAGHPRWNGPVLDTIAMAKTLVPGLYNYKLDTLAQKFGVTFRERHRSMGDVEATVEIFLKMLGQFRAQGAATLDQLMQKMTQRTYQNSHDRIPF